MAESLNYRNFQRLYYLTQVFATTSLILVACWMMFYSGGLGFQDHPDLEFRWHPLLMSLGMLYLNGEAILVYRGFRWAEKYRTKMVHLSLQAGAFLIALFGLKAAWDSHVLNKNPATGQLDPIPNFYSLHSWIGISTLSLFFFQFLFGFVVFFCPGAPLAVRKKAMPLHRSIGMIIFVLSLGSALLGISERAAWKMTCWTKDHEMCSEMLITNFFGIILVCYACGVIILVSYSPWQRLPLPSEEMHVSQNDDDYGSDTAPFINNRRHDDD